MIVAKVNQVSDDRRQELMVLIADMGSQVQTSDSVTCQDKMRYESLVMELNGLEKLQSQEVIYTGQEINELATLVDASGRFEPGKVYIAAIWYETYRTDKDAVTLKEFKADCLEAMREGTLVMSRIDTPCIAKIRLETDSETMHPVNNNALFHVVKL